MSENTSSQNPPVVDTPSPEGDGGKKGDAGEGDNKPVPYDSHRKLLDEKKRIQAELEAFKVEKKTREDKEAEEKGEYKKLLEQERKAREDAEGKLKNIDEQVKNARKMSAILGSAGGTIDEKWHDLVMNTALDMVAIDPDTGKVDQLSVTKAVEKLKASYPEIIKGKGGPRVPGDAPGASGPGAGKITRSEWLKLNSTQMMKYKADQIVDG